MKKTACIIFALFIILALSACGETSSPAETGEIASGTPALSVPASGTLSLPEPSVSQPAIPVSCVFNPAQFDGKIQSCAYAGSGKLFVAADKLYLYDTMTASVLGTIEMDLRDFDAQIIEGGYILSSMGDDGMMVYVYDDSLSLTKEITVNEILTGDFVVSEAGVAASTDGKKLAIAAMRGLYLYDLESESIVTLLDLTQNAGLSNIGIAMLTGLTFAQDNSQLIFYGVGVSIPAANGDDGFSIYGGIALDGSNLKLTKPPAYDIEEMQSRTSRLFFLQTFTQANGTLLWLDRKTGGANTLTFANSSEGRDGVYSSEWGNYVATAVLDGNLTVRIYDVASGELITTEVIENADSTYFNRIPRIYLLDDTKTAVVLLGGSISELDTLVSTFTFGE